jgi:hypothetical protein
MLGIAICITFAIDNEGSMNTITMHLISTITGEGNQDLMHTTNAKKGKQHQLRQRTIAAKSTMEGSSRSSYVVKNARPKTSNGTDSNINQAHSK